MSDQVTSPPVALPVERFVEAFVAKLVDSGWRGIVPRDPGARRGLAAVVDLLDQVVSDLEAQNIDWDKVVPWVRTANRLRPSSLGGVENWEHQLRAAQRAVTQVSNPSYESVDFTIDPVVARSALRRLTKSQRLLIERAVDTFEAKYKHAA